jgi:hypothetical protein
MVDAYSLTDGIVTQLISETGVGKRKRIISFRCREHFEDTSSNGTLLNFQIVLQENTNHIEFVYDEPRQDGTPNTPLGASSGIGFSFSDYRDIYADNYKYGGSITTQSIILNSTTGWQSNTKIKIKPYKSKTKLENKRRSQFLLDLDSDPYQYPVLKSPGDNERLGNVTTAFDDRNTIFYENNVKVSYPMNIPEGYSNINPKAASLTIGTGNIVKGVSSGKQFLTYLTHSLPELIKPFNDTGLYEENITDTFFLTGSNVSDVGEGFDSPLKSKSKVVLKFPVGSSTSLHATLPTIAYYNLSTYTFDIKTYASATLQGNMMDPDGSGTQTIGTNHVDEIPYVTASNGVINQDGVIGAGHDCILFNSFGVPVNTTGKFIFNAADTFRYSGTASPEENPGNQYSIFDSPRDFTKAGIYQYAVPNKLYSSSLKEIQNIHKEIVSPLTHKSWAATDSQKIIMSSSITEPFLLEKAIIKVPVSAGDGWFDDRTRALHAGFDFKSFDIGGPAVTVSLLRQDRDNIREIILSGTIIPAGDNESRVTAGNHDGTLGILENTDWDNGSAETDSNNRVYTNFWNGTSTFSNNKRNLGNFYTTSPPFLSRTDYGYAGFKSFSTPSVIVNPEIDPRTLAKSYSGDVILSTKAGVVNGAYLVNTTTDSVTSGSDVGLSNAKIFQVSNLGRTMNTVASARNLLAGELRMPSYQKDNDFSAGKNLTLSDGLYHPPRVYYRFTPDEGAESGGSFTAVLDFMSGSSFTSFETTGSGGEVSTTGIFNHTVSDRDTIYFQSGSGDGLVRPSATNSDADYDIFSLFDGATDDIANNVKRGRSISFFAKIECAPVSPVSLLGREYFPGTASSRYGWRLKLNSDATISLYVYDTNDELVEIIKTTSQIDDNQWHHIALTLETHGISNDFGDLSHAKVSKLRLYVDGVVQGIPLFYDVKFDSTGTGDVVYVAHSPDGEYAQLYMDELAYWSNAALSPLEISEIYNASQGGLPLYKTRRGSSPVYQYLEYTNSPYLLLPTDNIILAVSKTRPVRTTPVPDYKNLVTGSHDFTLKTGEIEIALYGSYVSQKRQKFTGLNQHLTNLSVHHVIGDEPVLDQFDVERTLILSGTYIDNIISGSMVDVSRGRDPGKLIYTTPTTANQRKVIGSNTNYNDQRFHDNIHSATDPRHTSNASYHLRFRFTGSLRTPHRNSVFYDKSEQFYDTLMPSFEKMLNKLGTNIFLYDIDNGIGFLSAVHSEGAGNSAYSSAAEAQYGSDVFRPLNDWYHRFPFEKPFNDLKRVQDPFSSFFGLGVDGIPVSNTGSNGNFKVKTLRVFQEGWTDTNTYFDNGPGGTDDILDFNIWRKFFYGFGDENTYSRAYKLTGSVGNSWDIKGNTNCPRHYGTNGTNPVAPILIRGWKYGIQNGFPENTNAVFRRNSYGQFRDMLEQRHDGKFYKNETNLPNVLGKAAVNTSPVQIRFVDSEGNIVKPGSTDSSNQHFEATSSLPYFDDGADYERIRNRGPLPVTVGARTVNELIGLNFRS